MLKTNKKVNAQGNIMKLLLSIVLITFIGCESNPYPEAKNQRDGVRTPTSQPDPRDSEKPPKDPLALAIVSQMDFKEGRNAQYQFKVEVRKPGTPIVWIENLPPGAEFDEEQMIISWKPTFFDGNDPKDPTVKVRTYSIIVNLRSSILSEQRIKENVILKVMDTPRAVTINGSSSTSVNEGSKLIYKFDINNADYPQGPFKVLTKDMPANTTLVQNSDTEYQLEFSPDYYHVNRSTDGRDLEYNAKIIVNNPANHTGEKEVEITVNDKRLGVNLQTPNTAQSPVLEQGLDASFQIVAYDLNKEITPDIEFTSSKPEFGNFKYELVTNEDSYSSIFNVQWLDIPPAYNGKTINIGFRACVLGEYRKDNCSNKTLKIAIKVKDRKAPVINRNNWPVGELIYLGFNQTETRRVQITDGEDPRITPEIEIFPTEMRKFVAYSGDILRMKFDKAGTYQFTIKATSDYKTSTTESFIIEVFPQDRSKVLFFADSTRDPEVKFYKDNLKEVSLMNPLIQTISLRSVKDRETLVLGTSVLFDKEASPQILKAMNEIKNLVIASPLMGNMPDKFLAELNDTYSTKFIGRYSELPTAPKIETMFFKHTTQFQTPMHQVGLKLTSSSESFNPLIFNGSLDNPNKNCKSVLGITPDGNSPYVVGVVCTRTNGGKLVLLGTEWADLKVHADDALIPALWFNTMLKGRF